MSVANWNKSNHTRQLPPGEAVFLDAATLDRGDLNMDALRQVTNELRCFAYTNPEQLAERTRHAWCVIVNKVVLDSAFFAARPDVKLICVVATGTDNVDLDAARSHEVTVVNLQGYSTQTVAQHVITFAMTFARQLPQYHAAVAAGDWSRSPAFCLLDYPIREIQDLKLGIMGYGAIGREVQRLATALGMNVQIAERPGQPIRKGRVSFDQVLASCDLISLHCPLTSETRHLIGREQLRKMKENALLINTARGALIDADALVQALQERWIGGAALDVLDQEPPSADHPLVRESLANLIITPHCAWGSINARQRALEQTVENISAWLAGQNLRRVV